MNKPELLAPAGNLEKLKYALAFGADAVYCGIPDFSLRVRINEFDMKSLKHGIDYAHKLGKKVYVTVNIFAHERHFPKLKKHIGELKKIKPDALIVSDPGVVLLIKKIWPKVELHLSTQANCTNAQAAKFWCDQGVHSINLGREVTLAEIKKIHRTLPKLRLEYFIHGAMCMSYSGRCLLSKYFTDRSANLGDCTQPCRWSYKIKSKTSETSKTSKTSYAYYLEESQRPGEFLEIDEDYHGSYIMNSKDLCLVEHLDKLIAAGVSSFKIEGRAKSIYFVANTVKIYRDAIDTILAGQKFDKKRVVEELSKCQNRGFTSGFLFGKEKCEQNVKESHIETAWEFCGEVVGCEKNLAKVRVHNELLVGDEVEILVPKGKDFTYKVKTILDRKGAVMREAHGGQDLVVYLPDLDAQNMSLLRKRARK